MVKDIASSNAEMIRIRCVEPLKMFAKLHTQNNRFIVNVDIS